MIRYFSLNNVLYVSVISPKSDLSFLGLSMDKILPFFLLQYISLFTQFYIYLKSQVRTSLYELLGWKESGAPP